MVDEKSSKQKKSKLEITAESLKKNKEILLQQERKLKTMITKEQSNLFKKIAPNLGLEDILLLINDPKKVEKLKKAIDGVLNEIFSEKSKEKKESKVGMKDETEPTT